MGISLLSYIYLLSHSFVSGWPHGHVFYTWSKLQGSFIFLLLLPQQFQFWQLGPPLVGFCIPVTHSHHCGLFICMLPFFLEVFTTTCPRPLLSIPCPSLRVSHSSKESQLLLLENSWCLPTCLLMRLVLEFVVQLDFCHVLHYLLDSAELLKMGTFNTLRFNLHPIKFYGF